jgi:6-phosphofructokinase 1
MDNMDDIRAVSVSVVMTGLVSLRVAECQTGRQDTRCCPCPLTLTHRIRTLTSSLTTDVYQEMPSIDLRRKDDMSSPLDFSIRRLGEAAVHSPIKLSTHLGDAIANYVNDDARVLYDIDFTTGTLGDALPPRGLFERAGPREQIFFSPADVHAGIITCGGLCPGLNNVIRAVVMTLWFSYGVRRISGIPYGYQGLLDLKRYPVWPLDPKLVVDIHREGGTILGSSRGGGDRTGELVDAVAGLGLDMLFTIGGDGTQRGALSIAEELARRNRSVAIVGVPKTIDNDLSFVEKSFGFETAVSQARQAVSSAHTEAVGAVDGIGIVKVMGRESGFIAAHTALANNDVNFVLIPEVPFKLEGANGLLANLQRRLAKRHHAVILVAEGAGQSLVATGGSDASGNKKLGDIGIYLKERIGEFFADKGIAVNIKYIDPSYIIRSAPANPLDAIYCARLGSNAAHAAMAGRTACIVGLVNNRLVHVPIEATTSQRNRIDPESPLWRDVLMSTGQPLQMV